MNRTIEKIRSFTVSPGIEKNEGNFRAPPRDPHPLRRRFIVFSLQNNRYSIPACRLASPLSLSPVSSFPRPSVLHVPARCPRTPNETLDYRALSKIWKQPARNDTSKQSRIGPAISSRWILERGNDELVSLTSTKERRTVVTVTEEQWR